MSKLSEHDARVYAELQKLAAVVPSIRLVDCVECAVLAIETLAKIKTYCEEYRNRSGVGDAVCNKILGIING